MRIKLVIDSLPPILVAARSEAWVCSLAGIVGSNPAGSMDVYGVLSGRGLCVGCSLVQRSPTECGVSECDREPSIVRRPWPYRGLSRHGKKE